jgi:hypothetical protein
VIMALGFFSTAYTLSLRFALAAARRLALTSGPRPAPTTCRAQPPIRQRSDVAHLDTASLATMGWTALERLGGPVTTIEWNRRTRHDSRLPHVMDAQWQVGHAP